MGVEYTLANHKDKTAYELGKGSWYALCGNPKRTGDECLLYEDTIYDMILREIWDYNISNPGPGETADTWREYAKKISKEIYKFVNDADPTEISLCNDSDDSNYELRKENYRWVGSRYESDDLVSLNRHLKE